MKNYLFIVVALIVSPLSLLSRSITQIALDEYLIQTVPVAIDKGNTTIMFPAPISGLYAAKISPVVVKNADFIIDFTPGKNYFCVRALKEKAEDVLTIIFEGKAYVIRLKGSLKPQYVVTFYRALSSNTDAKVVSPAKLISLIDKSKAYHLLIKSQPDALEGVSYYIPTKDTVYTNFVVTINEVWRFDEQDTIVFHLSLENSTDHEITYKPQDFAVRVGDQVYYQSVSDASGVMPPQSSTPAYFAITGNATGGRNYLSASNDWNVLVVRTEDQP